MNAQEANKTADAKKKEEVSVQNKVANVLAKNLAYPKVKENSYKSFCINNGNSIIRG